MPKKSYIHKSLMAAMMCVSFDLCLFSGEMKREIEKVRKYKYYIRGLQAAPAQPAGGGFTPAMFALESPSSGWWPGHS